MKNIEKELENLRTIFRSIGLIKFKPYFSYMGLFKDDTMFGLYKEKCLYLRKSDQYLQEIKDTIPIHFLSDHKISRQSKI